jgi:hypothetical protein
MDFADPIAGLMIARKRESLPISAKSPILSTSAGVGADVGGSGPGSALPARALLAGRFAQLCTAFHRETFRFSLPTKKHRVYREAQIEPGSLKNLTAQLKEGATA